MRLREYCDVPPARIACSPGTLRARPARERCEKLRPRSHPVVSAPTPESRAEYRRDANDLAWIPQLPLELKRALSGYAYWMREFSSRCGSGYMQGKAVGKLSGADVAEC